MRLNHIFSIFGIGAIVLLFFNKSTSQVVSSAQFAIDSVLIGDKISVDIKVVFPLGVTIDALDFSNYKTIQNQIYLQDTVSLEKYADLEILDLGSWKNISDDYKISAQNIQVNQENGQQVIKNTLIVSIYNNGIFSLPGPQVIGANGSQKLPTATKAIVVTLPPTMTKSDTIVLNPIRDIMVEKTDITDYLIYIYVLLGAIILAGLGYYYYKKKKQQPSETIVEPIIVEMPAHVKAIKALQALDGAQLWQQGYIKEYQSGLTDIIRTYLEDRYQVNAPEMTTEEVVHALHHVDFDPKYTNTLKEILQVADLVKFAKAKPDDDIHSIFMSKAIDFVENTKPTLPEKPMES